MSYDILENDLLAELERRMRQFGIPAVEAAQPGLTPAQMDVLTTPLGLSLPVEARRWWAWRNGVPQTLGPRYRELGPGRLWMPLEEAVGECERIRQMIAKAAETDPRTPEQLWSSSWLPIVQYDGLYVIDTDGPADAGCPVRVHWFDEPEAPDDFASISELVLLWIEALDLGRWIFDRHREEWSVNPEVLGDLAAARRGAV